MTTSPQRSVWVLDLPPRAQRNATGASCAAHAILAARGEWITNEKQLLTRTGLREMDDLLGAPDEAIDLCAARSPQRYAADLDRTRKDLTI